MSAITHAQILAIAPIAKLIGPLQRKISISKIWYCSNWLMHHIFITNYRPSLCNEVWYSTNQ